MDDLWSRGTGWQSRDSVARKEAQIGGHFASWPFSQRNKPHLVRTDDELCLGCASRVSGWFW